MAATKENTGKSETSTSQAQQSLSQRWAELVEEATSHADDIHRSVMQAQQQGVSQLTEVSQTFARLAREQVGWMASMTASWSNLASESVRSTFTFGSKR